ncbi:hypothetical protein JS562_26380 [Agrobacterium sp. S2]|nr:hypothetical protein [Agrobacterium sp. S2]
MNGYGFIILTLIYLITRDSVGLFRRMMMQPLHIYGVIFFARDKRQTERDHSVSRLWWMAHLCARVPIFDLKLALSAFLFKSDVRANLIERPTSSQSTALFGAVLRKLIESYEGDKELFNRRRFRDLMAEINSLGGYRLIDCFDANQANESISRIISEKLTT